MPVPSSFPLTRLALSWMVLKKQSVIRLLMLTPRNNQVVFPLIDASPFIAGVYDVAPVPKRGLTLHCLLMRFDR